MTWQTLIEVLDKGTLKSAAKKYAEQKCEMSMRHINNMPHTAYVSYQPSITCSNTKEASTVATVAAVTASQQAAVPPPLSLGIGRQRHRKQKLVIAGTTHPIAETQQAASSFHFHTYVAQ